MGNRSTVLLYNGVLYSSINIGLFNRVMDLVTRCSTIETIASRKMPTVKAVMEDPNKSTVRIFDSVRFVGCTWGTIFESQVIRGCVMCSWTVYCVLCTAELMQLGGGREHTNNTSLKILECWYAGDVSRIAGKPYGYKQSKLIKVIPLVLHNSNSNISQHYSFYYNWYQV